MAKTFKSVSIQGAASANRRLLKSVAEELLAATALPPMPKVLNALIDTGLVIEADLVKSQNGNFVFRVEEAPSVREVAIIGNTKVGLTTLRGVIQTQIGKKLNARTLAEDVKRIKRLYGHSGHQTPSVNVVREQASKNNTILRFEITEKEPSLANDGKPRTGFRRKKRVRSRNSEPNQVPFDTRTSEDDDLTDGSVPDDHQVGNARDASSPALVPAANEPAARAANVSDELPDSVVSEIAKYTSSWTGQFTNEDHIRTIRAVVPRAQSELNTLIELVEARRFNDPETEQAIELLRSLHHDLGLLIEAVEDAKHRPLLVRIARKNEKLRRLILLGAKIGVVAPALTIGISHMMSAITNVPIDSTMISTVFGTMVAMPFVEHQIANSTRKVSQD